MMAKHEVEWVAAMLEWCRICRPDLLDKVSVIAGDGPGADAFGLLMGIGFDAGRCFQHANPGCPLGPIMPGGDWEPITAAVHESRHEPVPDGEADA